MWRSGDGAPQGLPEQADGGQQPQQQYWQPAAYDPEAHRLAYRWPAVVPHPRPGEARPAHGYAEPAQPQFWSAAALPPRPPEPSRITRPQRADARASDIQAVVAVALIFVGLFCGVGAWRLHSERAHRATVPPATAVVARHAEGSALNGGDHG